MKMIKTTILTASLVCFASLANAQNSTPIAKEAKLSTAKPIKHVVKPEAEAPREYALPTDRLNNAFKGGVIPKDFPKFNTNFDKRENNKIGIKYLVDHQDLLTEDAMAYLKEHNHI